MVDLSLLRALNQCKTPGTMWRSASFLLQERIKCFAKSSWWHNFLASWHLDPYSMFCGRPDWQAIFSFLFHVYTAGKQKASQSLRFSSSCCSAWSCDQLPLKQCKWMWWVLQWSSGINLQVPTPWSPSYANDNESISCVSHTRACISTLCAVSGSQLWRGSENIM